MTRGFLESTELTCKTLDYAYNLCNLRVYGGYDENLNEAQIGAVSLTKEYYGQNFAYDEKNNVTAVSTLLGEKDNAVYDKFDNLTSYVQPGRDENDKYTFYYGDTDAAKKRHLPLHSETPLGLVAETKYDSYGNATESTTRGKPYSKSDGCRNMDKSCQTAAILISTKI